MQIINYSGQGILARFCISDEETKRCLELSLNVLKVQANIAFLIVNGKLYEYNTTGDIPFGENDTVYINTNGYCRLFFCYGEYSQTVIVTNKCNSNCIMCPYTSAFRKNTYDTDDVFLLKSIEYLPSNTRHLVITGGEPTLKDDVFFDLMRKIYDRFEDINCLLLTNGRSFSIERIINNARSIFHKNIIVAIPIHASFAYLHDSITQSKGSFQQTLKGIKNLINCDIAVEIRIVVFKQNYRDMYNIAELIANKFPEVSIVNFMAAEMCGNAALNNDNVWIDYVEAFANCKSAIDKLISSGIDVGIYNFPLCSVPKKYWGLYQKSISGYKVRFGKNCINCIEEKICGGVFASSLKYAESGLKPIMEKM